FVESGNTGTVITSNLIGVGADGTTGIPNIGNGVAILTNGVIVGGDPGSAGNVIASNGGHGVDVTSGSNNAIQGNSMYGNGGRGINLLADGSVPANDACDVDGGSNGLANWPVLATASSLGGLTQVTGTHNSAASTTFRVEFFVNTAGDAVDHRAGRSFFGAANVTTDASCNAAFNFSFPIALAPGEQVTATSIDPSGNTSVFSNAVVVSAPPAPVPTISAIRPNSGSMAGGSAVVIEGTNLDTTTSVMFSGNSGQVFGTIVAASPGSLTVTAPGYPPGGAVDVVVTNAAGSVTSTGGFTYVGDDNAARDFSLSNPSPRWTYGYETARGATLTPYSIRFKNGALDVWSSNGAEPLLVH